MILFGKYFLVFGLLFLTACSSIPKNTSDGCSIFSERYLWYKHAKKTEKKWGTPINLQLAIIKMESDFDWLALNLLVKSYLKLYLIKDPLVHSDTHKLSKVRGNNIKMRPEINML